MKFKLQAIFILLLITLLLGAGMGIPHGEALAQDTIPSIDGMVRSVSVSASGEVSSQPDTAFITVGVQTEADEAAAALTENNEQMQELIDALNNAGVDSEDIQTQAIRLQPRYTDQPDDRSIRGFMAVNMVEVRVNDLDNLGSLMDAAIQSGGNTINQIRLEILENAELIEQARETAMQSARQKASALADLADAQLGPVISIREDSSSRPPVAFGGAAAQFETAAVPVEAGTQNVTVNVNVTWELIVGTDSD